MQRIRVLVVDDTNVVRRVVAQVLADDPRIEVVDTALNGRVALEKIEQLKPDLVTVDLEMPVMGGLEMLAALRARQDRTPVIVFGATDPSSAAGVLDALAAGASDYVTMPSSLARITDAIDTVRAELVPKIIALIESAARATVRDRVESQTRSSPSPAPNADVAPELIVIGTSTGGPQALQAILPELPENFPVPILIVQHMPAAFTATLARSLDQHCRLRVAEAWQGADARAGQIWIAPGDHHLTVERTATGCRLHLDQGPKENSCRPAVDPLFRSAADAYGARVLGVVLTGMGADGLAGARALRSQGARVVVQDEATSVVWGMPGAVAAAGQADQVLSQTEIAAYLQRSVQSLRFRRPPTSTD